MIKEKREKEMLRRLGGKERCIRESSRWVILAISGVSRPWGHIS